MSALHQRQLILMMFSFHIKYYQNWSQYFLICLFSNFITLSLHAGELKEHQVKVSYIYNFAKFIKWPALPNRNDDTSFVICIEGHQPLSGYLSLLQDREIEGRKITVRAIANPDERRNCKILFISDSEEPRLAKILPTVAALPVLTISDLPDFIQSGGIIAMKIQDNRVRFDINLGAAHKADLAFNSQLLKLAVEVVQ